MKFREADKLLRQNGWRVTRVKGSHYQYSNNDFDYIVTLIVHGHSADIPRGVLASLKRSTGIEF